MATTTASLTDEEINNLLSPDGVEKNTPGSTTPIEGDNPADKKTETTETTVIPKGKEGFLTPEDIADDLSEEEKNLLNLSLKKDKDDEDKSSDSKDNKDDKGSQPSTADEIDYGKYYQYLVSNGSWFPLQDDEGKPLEEVELTETEFQELVVKQAEWKAEEVLKERESEFGSQYSEFVEFMKNGGDVADLAASVSEQRDIEAYDISDPEDAKAVIIAHCEAMGWSQKRINTYVDSLQDAGDDSLTEAASESKEKLIEAVSENRKALLEQQALQKKTLDEARERFSKNLREAIYKDSKLSDRDKKELDKFYFEHKHPIQGGKAKASDFYLKYQEIQSDPTKFAKLVKFINKFEDFEEKSTTEKEVNKKNFNFLRTSNFSKKKETEEPDYKEQKFNKRPGTFDRYKS